MNETTFLYGLLAVWIAFAFLSFRRKWGGFIAIAGGFLFTVCLAVLVGYASILFDESKESAELVATEGQRTEQSTPNPPPPEKSLDEKMEFVANLTVGA